jgi:hypothetical protein
MIAKHFSKAHNIIVCQHQSNPMKTFFIIALFLGTAAAFAPIVNLSIRNSVRFQVLGIFDSADEDSIPKEPLTFLFFVYME